MNYTKFIMIARLRRLGIGAAIGLFVAFGVSIFCNVVPVNAAAGERVTVTAKPAASKIKPDQLVNIGDDVITLKQGNNTIGTQKVKPQLANLPSVDGGDLFYTATFDPVQPGTYSVCSEKATTCVEFQKAANADKPVEITGQNPPIATPGADEEKVCSTGTGLANTLSWVLCPLAQLMVDATGFIERNLIIPYLTVSPLQTGDNPVYKLWESVRNIANVLFIVAFFIIIFSQATSLGLSNYGIKRLLPRLGFVAIGTNLSYFVVAFAIDAFNVFGAGISELVMTAIAGGGGTGGAEPNGGNIFAITVVVGAPLLLATAITSAGAVLGWLFSLLGIAFLILLIAVIVLVLRQMIILLLVIVAPLAFVAWLLPNTEKYFTKWRSLLIQLLMMYPLIVLLFATGKIVQRLIVGYDFDLASGEGVAEGSAEAIKVIMGFFAAAVPLVALPATFAAAGGLMGKMYGALQTRGRDWGKAGFGKARERLEPRIREKQLQMSRSNSRVLRTLGGGRLLRREYQRQRREGEYERAKAEYLANQVLGNKKFAKSAAGIGGQEGVGRVTAYAENVIAKLDADELRMAMDQLRRSVESHQGAASGVDRHGNVLNGGGALDQDAALIALAQGGKLTTADGKTVDGSTRLYREAAMQKLANLGRSDQIRTVQDYYANDPTLAADQKQEGTAAVRRAINDNFSPLLGKAPDLVKGPGTAFGDATGETMASFNKGTIAAMARHMDNMRATGDTAAFNKAAAALESSIESIAKTPQLASKFSGDSGKELLRMAAGGPGTGIDAATAATIASALSSVTIDPTSGKVK